MLANFTAHGSTRSVDSSIKALLLDVDGTLLNSNEAHTRAWVEALDEHGFSARGETIRSMIGMGGDRILPQVANLEEDSDLGKAIVKSRKTIFSEWYLPHLKAFPHVRDLLLKLKELNLRLLIASSSEGEILKELLRHAGVEDLVETPTSKDDVESSKPSPDLINAILDKTGLKPNEVMMVGDTPYDVEAATRAGVRAIAFTCGGWSAEHLQNAAFIYRDAADMLEHLDETPLSSRSSKPAEQSVTGPR